MANVVQRQGTNMVSISNKRTYLKSQFMLFLFCGTFLLSCKKEELPKYELQYEVLSLSGSKAKFAVHFLDASGATVSTGIKGPETWLSPRMEIEKGKTARMEVQIKNGTGRLHLKIKKNNSLASEKIISGSTKPFVIETVM